MRPNILDLDRRFVEIGDEESLDDELRVRRLLGQSVGMGWDEVLEHPRVVLLAEAGLGKTTEMEAATARLRAAGELAVFLPIEVLRDGRLEELISPQEHDALSAWRASPECLAWFFLDAVDELKLLGGTLSIALRRVRAALGDALDRARIVVSCRPSDWAAFADLARFEDLLPSPITGSEAGPQPVKRVRLLPLDDHGVALLAKSRGIADPDALIERLHETASHDLASRPLDALRMIEAWLRTGDLGTRAEQMAAEVDAAVEAAPKHPATGSVDPAALRRAAERLAFALVAMRSLHVRVPEGEPLGTDAVEPASVLPHATPATVEGLLRCALFDPATYGRVRFRHRSVMEHLAARHLHERLHGGPRRASVERLVFVRRYGHEVVPVHLRGVAAWLALWDDRIRRRLQAIEPQTLLEGGDPQSLSRGAKIDLLRSYVELHGAGDWRGVGVPAREIARLAEPSLAGEVRELWMGRGTNPEVAELLLQVMWTGRMVECRDLLSDVAWDEGASVGNRMIAVAGLGACEAVVELRAVGADIIARPSAWPVLLVHGTIQLLYPSAIDEDALARLVERHAGRRQDRVSLEFNLQQIAEEIDPTSPAAERLRAKLLRLFEREAADSSCHDPRSAYPVVGRALATLCRRLLEARPADAPPEVVRAGLVLHYMDRWGHGDREGAQALDREMRSTPDRRRALYLQEVTFLCDQEDGEDSRIVRSELASSPASPLEEDIPWLLEIARGGDEWFMRAVALEVLLAFCRDRGEDDLI